MHILPLLHETFHVPNQDYRCYHIVHDVYFFIISSLCWIKLGFEFSTLNVFKSYLYLDLIVFALYNWVLQHLVNYQLLFPLVELNPFSLYNDLISFYGFDLVYFISVGYFSSWSFCSYFNKISFHPFNIYVSINKPSFVRKISVACEQHIVF